jgi:hypothetical protein
MRATKALLIAGLVATVACGGRQDEEASTVAQAAAPRSLVDLQKQEAESPLQADQHLYEFGDVPIGGGKVSTAFQVSNAGASPVRLVSVYTSCGCTTAEIEFVDGSKAGPFGMPGHELPTDIDRTVSAGENFTVRVFFDPAAHGPEGLGKVMRAVTLHTEDGTGIRLAIMANVVQG